MINNSASILTIGDELLIGQITDTNSVWIGRQLDELGWHIVLKETVGDEVAAIVEALTRMRDTSRVVLVTGGLGPTSDDRTLEAMADFFKTPLILFPEVEDKVRQYFASRGREISNRHLKQFYLPKGIEVLTNEVGTAPGMHMNWNDTHFFFTPGVPVELKYIFRNHIFPELEKLNKGSRVQTRMFTAGLGETTLVERLGEGVHNWPLDLTIAYLPYMGGVRLRLTALGVDSKKNEDLMTNVVEDFKTRLGSHLISTEYDQWNDLIQYLMIRNQLTLATAESCTGGYIASQITDVGGSSGYFAGSVVSYSNAVKRDVLGVKVTTLDAYGAVSSQCAGEMLDGVLTLLKTDIAIAVTGIAGPGGGTEAKPVGTVFVAVGNQKRKVVQRFYFRSSRKGVVEYTYNQAMYLLFKFLSTQ